MLQDENTLNETPPMTGGGSDNASASAPVQSSDESKAIVAEVEKLASSLSETVADLERMKQEKRQLEERLNDMQKKHEELESKINADKSKADELAERVKSITGQL